PADARRAFFARPSHPIPSRNDWFFGILSKTMPPMFDPDAIDGPDEEREGPSDEDLARFGYAATATVRCYECGRQLHEEATICPACGAFQISDDDLPA